MAKLLFVVISMMLADVSLAESIKSKVVAGNGVKVTVSTDAFADRTEYLSPQTDVSGDQIEHGKTSVGLVKSAGSIGPTHVWGFVTYSGGWAFFDSAILKGGEKVEFRSIEREVGSCRYGCTLSETFAIMPTVSQIVKYTFNGNLVIQVRGHLGKAFFITVPENHIKAIEEVAK